MVDFAALNAQRERYKAFIATDLGRAYHEALRAAENYAALGDYEHVSDKRLRELDTKMRETQAALKEKLMEIAGV